MAVVVIRPSGDVDTYEAGYLHATCGQVIVTREACPHCGSRPFLETLDRAVPWVTEEDDGSLVVHRGTTIARVYPVGTWEAHSRV